MYCGSCIHDNTVAAALQKMGHEVALLPTYTPMRTDEENVSSDHIFYGAINVYLEQKSAFFRGKHRAIHWLLNRRGLLNFAARFSGSTDARELGELSLGVLQGEAGPSQKELDELVTWLKDSFQPDLVHITNSLFLGLVRRLKAELRVPVIVAVQGEDLFIDELPESYRDRVIEEMRQRAQEVDAFLAPCEDYAGRMAELLAVPKDKMQVIPLGIHVAGHDARLEDNGTSELAESGEPAERAAIGYLARIAPEKGLHVLVDAFTILAEKPEFQDLQLRVAGYLGAKDRPYYLALERKLADAGLIGRYDFLGEVDRPAKISFLRSLTVFSVPTVYREAKGLFVLEALANGVPVVQPNHGSFPELLEATGGGILVEPDSPEALADGLAELLHDPGICKQLGRRGRASVLQNFDDVTMAKRTAEFYERILSA